MDGARPAPSPTAALRPPAKAATGPRAREEEAGEGAAAATSAVGSTAAAGGHRRGGGRRAPDWAPLREAAMARPLRPAVPARLEEDFSSSRQVPEMPAAEAAVGGRAAAAARSAPAPSPARAAGAASSTAGRGGG